MKRSFKMKTTIKNLLAFGLVAGALSAATLHIDKVHAQTRQVDCELVYSGETKIKARCDFENISDMFGPGSFRITKNTGANGFSSEVQVTAPGVADAMFTTKTGDSEETVGAGEVRRNGACWSNDEIKICARSLAQAPAKAKAPAKKAPPKKAVPSKAN
jgi:hypothetical protein